MPGIDKLEELLFKGEDRLRSLPCSPYRNPPTRSSIPPECMKADESLVHDSLKNTHQCDKELISD
jgi:hypothetical protein